MKRVKFLAIFLTFVMALFMFAGCSNKSGSAPAAGDQAPSGDADNKTYILRIGTGTAGKHPQNVWMEAYKEALEKATNGRIEVQLYSGGQLGTMAELVQGLGDGTVDSGCFPTSYFSTNFPAAACTDLSFTFKDSEQLWRILTENKTKYQALFEDNGLVIGAWLRNCDRTIISSTPIKSMSDLKNKKLWCTPSKVIQKEVGLLGAVTSNVDVGELAPSVQNGTVDGAIADITLYRAQSLHNAGAKYMLMAPKDALVTCFAFSKHWWDKVPEDLRNTAREVAKQVVLDVEYPYIDQFVADAYKAMQEGGMEVIEPSEQFMADLKAALAPQKDWFLQEYPDAKPIYDELCDFVAKDK